MRNDTAMRVNTDTEVDCTVICKTVYCRRTTASLLSQGSARQRSGEQLRLPRRKEISRSERCSASTCRQGATKMSRRRASIYFNLFSRRCRRLWQKSTTPSRRKRATTACHHSLRAAEGGGWGRGNCPGTDIPAGSLQRWPFWRYNYSSGLSRSCTCEWL